VKEYSVKNIIFGLRGEYLKFQDQVNGLKKYILCDHDYDLYLTRLNDRAPLDAVITFEEDAKRPKSDMCTSTAGFIYEGKTNNFYENDHIKFTDKDKFTKEIKDINETDFSQNMPMYIPDMIKKPKGISNIILFDNLMEYRYTDNMFSINKSVIYNPYDDKIYFENNTPLKNANEKMIRNILDDTIPEYAFRRYHKEIMGKYGDKEIIIENSKRNNKCTCYTIIDNEKQLILKR